MRGPIRRRDVGLHLLPGVVGQAGPHLLHGDAGRELGRHHVPRLGLGVAVGDGDHAFAGRIRDRHVGLVGAGEQDRIGEAAVAVAALCVDDPNKASGKVGNGPNAHLAPARVQDHTARDEGGDAPVGGRPRPGPDVDGRAPGDPAALVRLAGQARVLVVPIQVLFVEILLQVERVGRAGMRQLRVGGQRPHARALAVLVQPPHHRLAGSPGPLRRVGRRELPVPRPHPAVDLSRHANRISRPRRKRLFGDGTNCILLRGRERRVGRPIRERRPQVYVAAAGVLQRRPALPHDGRRRKGRRDGIARDRALGLRNGIGRLAPRERRRHVVLAGNGVDDDAVQYRRRRIVRRRRLVRRGVWRRGWRVSRARDGDCGNVFRFGRLRRGVLLRRRTVARRVRRGHGTGRRIAPVAVEGQEKKKSSDAGQKQQHRDARPEQKALAICPARFRLRAGRGQQALSAARARHGAAPMARRRFQNRAAGRACEREDGHVLSKLLE